MASPAWEVERQVAWARLYGAVRWFHPSDEVLATDLDRLACEGVRRAQGADDPTALAASLSELLKPIAPTARIWADGDTPEPWAPSARKGLKPTAWVHVGVDHGEPPYSSTRSGLVDERPASGTGVFGQSMDARPHAGLPYRFSARLRSEGGRVQLWFRTDGPEAGRSFANTADSPVTSSTWTHSAVEGVLPGQAERLVFGALITSGIAGRMDDFRLEVERDGAWVDVPLVNPGLDAGVSGWFTPSREFTYTVDDDGLLMTRTGREKVRPVRHPVPPIGSTTELDLGGLKASVPLVLHRDANGTVPRGQPLVLPACDDATSGVAAVLIAWNVFQHFYPYFDVVDARWDEALPEAIRGALTAERRAETHDVLRRMTARLQDGHVDVTGVPAPTGQLPFAIDRLGGELVVTASGVPEVRPGDVIHRIAGEPALTLHERAIALRSGSPQWTAHRTASSILQGPRGTSVELVVEDRDVTQVYGPPWKPAPGPPVRTLDDGVMVVDIAKIEWQALRPQLGALSKAPGVVFDGRGYPESDEFLRNLLTKRDRSRWMFTPVHVWPDRREVDWRPAGWKVRPARPHLDNIAWLIGPGSISFAESLAAYVDGYQLGPLVGRATAGANGAVNRIDLPDGFTVFWTGMKVLRHDGGVHHLRGVEPTHPVEPTPAGLKAGRDEVLDAAVELVRQAAGSKGVR